MFLNMRLKIRDFIRKYKYIMILIIIGFSVILVINQYFKTHRAVELPEVSYQPNQPIINENQQVPKEEQEPIEDLISQYVSYCNQKDYQKAYNLLSSDCKAVVYPTVQDFKEYIDMIFDQKKIHNIQNMSNIDGKYIYRVRFLNDILASGMTGEDTLWYDEDIITVVTENGEKKLAIREFIQKDQLNRVYENEYMRLEIENRYVQYEAETYNLKVTNRSEYTIVLADFTKAKEISIQVGAQKLDYTQDFQNRVIIRPGQTGYYTLRFRKYYDLSASTSQMNFDYVRILKSYSGNEAQAQQEIENAERVYSLQIPL